MSDASKTRWAIAFETALPLALLALGFWLLIRVEKPSEWPGLILIALGIFAYMARGQIITKLAWSKDGFSADLAAKTQEALDRAQAAQQSADLAKQAVKDYAVSEAPAAEVPADGVDPWSHPAFERKPAPSDDVQKHQWGGEPERNGRRLSAIVAQVDDGWYEVRLRVEATDPKTKPLIGKVRFHLHQSFGNRTAIVKPVNNAATLNRVAYGAFTVGAEVEDEPGTYLELDMSAPGFDAPRKFKAS